MVARWRVLVWLALAAAPSSSLLLGAGRTFSSMRIGDLSSSSLPVVARSHIVAQEADGGERERSRGRTITVARPKPKPKSERREAVEHDKSWRVLLHNDDVHTFDYVTMAIVKVVKTITRKKAHRITVQAHSMGTATVTTTWKQMAKTMCLKLQKFGLTSSIAPDGSGKPDQ